LFSEQKNTAFWVGLSRFTGDFGHFEQIVDNRDAVTAGRLYANESSRG
jgi:hypothetical protein